MISHEGVLRGGSSGHLRFDRLDLRLHTNRAVSDLRHPIAKPDANACPPESVVFPKFLLISTSIFEFREKPWPEHFRVCSARFARHDSRHGRFPHGKIEDRRFVDLCNLRARPGRAV